MKLKNVPFYLSHPKILGSTLLYRFRTLFQPDLPWLSYEAVKFCAASPYRKKNVFEWGSGRSTLWFGKRCESMTSVESNAEWHRFVRRKLEQNRLDRVNCLFVSLDDAGGPPPADDPQQPAYVRAIDPIADDSLDLVIVDGYALREACIQRALPKIRGGGWLLVDNTNWIPLAAWGVPPSWEILHQSRNPVTETTIWRKPVGSGA